MALPETFQTLSWLLNLNRLTVAELTDVAFGGAVSTADIADAAVTLAKIATQPDLTILGNNTGGAASPIALTAAQVRTLLALATIATSGSADDLGSGTLPVARIATAALALGKLATQSDATILGNNTGSSASPLALTAAQVVTLLQAGNSGACAVYYTAPIDFLTTSSSNALVPAKAGYYFVPIRLQVFIKARTGTASGNLVFQIGNNSTTQNNLIQAQTITAAAVNVATAPVSVFTVGGNQTATTADATTAYSFRITTALTGSSVCTGVCGIEGFWLPV